MNSEILKVIQLSSDNDFLHYAKYFRMSKDNMHDFNLCVEQIVKRCKSLGYTFTLGCCGKNELKRITNEQL
jgi:hypothetical protein